MNIYSNLFFKYFQIFKYQFEFRIEALVQKLLIEKDSFLQETNAYLKKHLASESSSDLRYSEVIGGTGTITSNNTSGITLIFFYKTWYSV